MGKLTWSQRGWMVVIFCTTITTATKYYIKILKDTVREV